MTPDVDQAPPIGSPASNALVRENLARHGDDGSVEREVEHFCYADPGYDQSEPIEILLAVLEEKDFVVNKIAGEDGGPDWLRVVQHREVASVGFDLVTEWFLFRLHNLGWVYDGWSCSVLPGPSAEKE